nr:hypothetical protein [Candidatus Gracilibacteria bacterium]
MNRKVLNYDNSLIRLKELKISLNKENQEKLDEVLGKMPKSLSENSKKVISEYTNRLIESIGFFKKLYKNENEINDLNGVIKEVIISFRHNVKHSLSKK